MKRKFEVQADITVYASSAEEAAELVNNLLSVGADGLDEPANWHLRDALGQAELEGHSS